MTATPTINADASWACRNPMKTEGSVRK